MDKPRILSPERATSLGMVPLLESMRADDPLLFQSYKDMATVARDEWAVVNEGAGMFSIWRIPKFSYRENPPDFSDGCRPTKRRRKLKVA